MVDLRPLHGRIDSVGFNEKVLSGLGVGLLLLLLMFVFGQHGVKLRRGVGPGRSQTRQANAHSGQGIEPQGISRERIEAVGVALNGNDQAVAVQQDRGESGPLGTFPLPNDVAAVAIQSRDPRIEAHENQVGQIARRARCGRWIGRRRHARRIAPFLLSPSLIGRRANARIVITPPRRLQMGSRSCHAPPGTPALASVLARNRCRRHHSQRARTTAEKKPSLADG
jgi:hypothetical protein